MELDVYRYDEGRLKRYVMLPEKLEYNHPDLVQSIKTKDIVIGIDPSKTGYGITVMSKNSETLGMFELKGADVDVDTFSASLESMIKTLFKGSHVLSCGQEQVILGKAYQPMVVLNEVRVRTKMAFNDLGIYCEEINNHTWKADILPVHLRKKTVKKGSLEFVNKLLGTNIKSDNVTDSWCVARYLVEKLNNNAVIYPDEKVIGDSKYMLSDVTDSRLPQFTFNYSMSFKENSDYIQHMNENTVAVALVDINLVNIEELYRVPFNVSKDIETRKLYFIANVN